MGSNPSRSMLNRDDLCWLAGLLEGEGSFMRGTPSNPNQPIIALHMKDEDVVARVAALIGVSYQRVPSKNPRWSETFSMRVRGKRARRLMATLRPYMGIRRQAQIDAALASYDPNYGRKLTPSQIIEIVVRLEAGEAAAALAQEFEISWSYVYKLPGRVRDGLLARLAE